MTNSPCLTKSDPGIYYARQFGVSVIVFSTKPFPGDNYIFVLPLCWSGQGGETSGQAEHGNGGNSWKQRGRGTTTISCMSLNPFMTRFHDTHNLGKVPWHFSIGQINPDTITSSHSLLEPGGILPSFSRQMSEPAAARCYHLLPGPGLSQPSPPPWPLVSTLHWTLRKVNVAVW